MTDAQDTPSVENTIENGAEKAPERENAPDMENTIENGADKEGTFEGELDSEGRSGDKEKKPFYLGIRAAPDAANFFCQLLADSPLLTLGNLEPLFQRLSMPIQFARDLHSARKEYKKELREIAHARQTDAENKFRTNDPSENQVISDKDGVKITEIGNTGQMEFGKDGRGKINTLEKMYAVERTEPDGTKTLVCLTKNELKKEFKDLKIPTPRLTDAEKQTLCDTYSLTERQMKRLNEKYKPPKAQQRPTQNEKAKETETKEVRPKQTEKDQKKKETKAKDGAERPKKKARSKEKNPELKNLRRQQKRLEKKITEAEKQNPNFDKTPEGKKLYDKLILNDIKQQQVKLEAKITGAEKQNPNYDKTKEGKADYKKLIELDKQATSLKQTKKDNKNKGLTLAAAPKQIGTKRKSSKQATTKARTIKEKEASNNKATKSLESKKNRLLDTATRTTRSASKQKTATKSRTTRTPMRAPAKGRDGSR